MTSTLYRRGRVRSSADPFATALLVDGGTVAWVGGEAAADALPADVVVDLDDAWVAPAFVAMHVGWGLGFWQGVMDVMRSGRGTS